MKWHNQSNTLGLPVLGFIQTNDTLVLNTICLSTLIMFSGPNRCSK